MTSCIAALRIKKYVTSNKRVSDVRDNTTTLNSNWNNEVARENEHGNENESVQKANMISRRPTRV